MSMTTLGQVKKTTNTIFTCTLEIIQYALKGQKFLAQGIALGNYERQPVALKGRVFKNRIKIWYKKWCYIGVSKLLIFNTLIYKIVLCKFA